MKKLRKRWALAALGLALWAPAKADDLHSFSIDTTTYRLLPSSVSTKTVKSVLTISGLWEVAAPDYNSRWYVEVRNCYAPIGEITIHNGTQLKSYGWTLDGNRALDMIAVTHCVLNLPEKKK